MATTTESVAGLLLAGGQSSRMGGGDKCLTVVAGRTLLERVIERARPQVSTLVLNANGDPARFAAFGLPVIGDVIEGYAGPLAGILTGLEWVRDNLPGTEWMASFATDTPLFPTDLVGRLRQAVADAQLDIACAVSGGRAHPVFGLWPVRLAADLREAVVRQGVRKVEAWTGRYRVAYAQWPGRGDDDPFLNANTPEELERLARLLAG